MIVLAPECRTSRMAGRVAELRWGRCPVWTTKRSAARHPPGTATLGRVPSTGHGGRWRGPGAPGRLIGAGETVRDSTTEEAGEGDGGPVESERIVLPRLHYVEITRRNDQSADSRTITNRSDFSGPPFFLFGKIIYLT